MNRLQLCLDSFSILLSFLGLVLPSTAPLRFLFPHTEVSLAGLVLGAGAIATQLRELATRKWLLPVGLLLLFVTLERLIRSTATGLINSRVSHADLFVIAPLAVSYLLATLQEHRSPATPAAASAAYHSPSWHLISSRSAKAFRQHSVR